MVLPSVRETGLQLLRLVLSYAFRKALATLLLLGDRRRVDHRSLVRARELHRYLHFGTRVSCRYLHFGLRVFGRYLHFGRYQPSSDRLTQTGEGESPWRVHPPASTLPAVARATAGRFVRCEYLIGRGVGVPRGPASGFWVGCSPVRDSLESGGPAALGHQWLRPLTTDRQPCGEQLTQKSLAGPLGTPTPRPIRYSHLTKRPAVARATAACWQ